MSDAPATPKPKRPLWRRLLRWAIFSTLGTGLLLVLLLAAGVWYASHHRVRLANRALENLGPFRGHLEVLDFDPRGNFDMRGLELKDKTTGEMVVRLPRVTGRFAWSGLGSRGLESLVLEEPELHLDESTLESLLPAKDLPAESKEAAAGTGDLRGYRLGRLELRNARISYSPGDDVRHEVVVNYRGDALAVNENGRLESGAQELAITQAAPTAPDAPYGVQELRAKGQVDDGLLTLEEVLLDQPVIRASPGLLRSFGLTSPAEPPPAPALPLSPDAAVSLPPVPPLSAGLLRVVRIGKFQINGLAASAQGFTPGNATGLQLPDASIIIPRYEIEGLDWEIGKLPSMGGQKLMLQDMSIASQEDEGYLRFKELRISLEPVQTPDLLAIRNFRLIDPDIYWTPGLRRLLTQRVAEATGPPKEAAPAVPTPPASRTDVASGSKGKLPALQIAAAAISGARVKLADPGLLDFQIEAKAGILLANLRLDETGWYSKNFQNLELTEGRLLFPGGVTAHPPFFELPRGELVMNPDEWNATMKVARLTLEKPVVRLRDGNTPWVPATVAMAGPPFPVPLPGVTPPAEPKQATPAPAAESPTVPPQQPWWKRLHYGQLIVTEGYTDMVLHLPKPIDMRSRLNINTERTTTGGSRHRVRIEDFSGSLPTLSKLPFPVMQAALLEGSVLLPEMWSDRRIEEVLLTGANFELGQPLIKLFEPEKPVAEAMPSEAEKPKVMVEELVPQAPAARRKGPWKVGHIAVKKSAISILNLVPGLETVQFGIGFEVRETPLLLEDILRDATPQRIELANLRIPAIQEPIRSVAELDTIFITFSLQGLARKEVEKVEIVSPTLRVGEDLFRYVDYYRQYMAAGTDSAHPAPKLAANDDDTEFEITSTVVESEPPPSEAAWSVKRLQVHGGKLLIAPKGKPLFEAPFPFKVDTEVTQGTLEADLDIPKDTYALPPLDLQLVGMRGKVQFNLPLKQKDNNLTETFEVDSIRYENLRTGKAYLSVTYDKAGIYAKFGAEAYEGYLSGEANVYLSDSYHWDGWIDGKDVQTRELTEKLCPGYFFMKGKVQATLVANGAMDELYQADAKFKNLSPGTLSIRALNGLIKDLPNDWQPAVKKLTQIGLETLRDFDYERAEMQSRFYGREGKGTIKFSGPTGSRNFEINVYDHRWQDDNAVKAQAAP